MSTILHISDLHRDPKNPLSTQSLLLSLIKDKDRYLVENPIIGSPDVIVISGDIVQGVGKDSLPGDDELRKQYDEAYEFLSRLSEHFLGGNTGRVVIVPGNHDVCDITFKKSIKRIDIAGKDAHTVRSLTQELFKPRTRMRWAWNTLELFEIENNEQYLNRFEPFARFYERFYGGTRAFSLAPEKQYDIFYYKELRLLFAGFNSCFDNDIFNREGQIHPDCLAAVGLELRKPIYGGALAIAVWHHSTSGTPQRSDYMDRDILDVMIDNGFTIGLYGHQHRARVVDEVCQFRSENKIALVSAGTLCGGTKSLPIGQRRSYNVITLNNAMDKGIVSLREMQNDRFDMPIWGKGILERYRDEELEFNACPFPNTVMESSMSVVKAEELMNKGSYDEAIPLLQAALSSADGGFARRFLLECYVRTCNQIGIIELFNPPSSEEEFVYVVDALWELNMIDELSSLLKTNNFLYSDDPMINEIINKYSKRLELKL